MEITRKELKNLYYSNFNKVVAQKLNISAVTLLKLIKDNHSFEKIVIC